LSGHQAAGHHRRALLAVIVGVERQQTNVIE